MRVVNDQRSRTIFKGPRSRSTINASDLRLSVNRTCRRAIARAQLDHRLCVSPGIGFCLTHSIVN